MSTDRLTSLVNARNTCLAQLTQVADLIPKHPTPENIQLLREIVTTNEQLHKNIVNECILRVENGEDLNQLKEKYNL